ncbi:MAG: nucleoside 2-deoxyribosyltransferase [Acidiphilium sp.]|nr:nucleoside 2-deoxyribosyltransferase [Acidiphilium sp.]MDD4936642.1 nucleoside 2-deoxyribosyltransferase [Acidiphilium sp.]
MTRRVTAYLAGPDVFLPNATEHAARKVALAARYGITALAPLNDASTTAMDQDRAWRAIFHKDIAMMEASDIIIANLTPFRGASADAGTLVELGWFLGRGRPVFGYSNSAARFDARSRAHTMVLPDDCTGLTHEGFGLADNLMVVGVVIFGGNCPMVVPEAGGDLAFDALDIFERCVAAASEECRRLRLPHPDVDDRFRHD